jgi:hypothetical protein
VQFVFDVLDATPDLPEFGPLRAKVQMMEKNAATSSLQMVAQIEGPGELAGLTIVSETRYEEESLALALTGRPVTVNAHILDRARRSVGGGIATMVVQKA